MRKELNDAELIETPERSAGQYLFYIRRAELQNRGHSDCKSIVIDPQPGFRWYSSDSAKWAIVRALGFMVVLWQ